MLDYIRYCLKTWSDRFEARLTYEGKEEEILMKYLDNRYETYD